MLRQQPPTSGYGDQERESTRNVAHAKILTSGSRPANVAQEAAARVLAGQKIGSERGSGNSSMQPRQVVPVAAATSPAEFGIQVGSMPMQGQSSPSERYMQPAIRPSGDFLQAARTPPGSQAVQVVGSAAVYRVPSKENLPNLPFGQDGSTSRGSASSEATPTPIFQAPAPKESHRHDATPPRVDPSVGRQDSLASPTGPDEEAVQTYLTHCSEHAEAVVSRRSKQYQRQDSLPSEGDVPQHEVHGFRPPTAGSGRHLDASPKRQIPSSATATSSQPAREPDQIPRAPHSQPAMQAESSRLEEERLNAIDRHRRDGRAPGDSFTQGSRAPGDSFTQGSRAPGDSFTQGEHSSEAQSSQNQDRSRRNSGDAGQPADQKLKADNQYLRRNVEHLRKVKHVLERHIKGLEARNQWLEQQMGQYKATLEQKQLEQAAERAGRAGGNDATEIRNLTEQLEAVMNIKQALNMENEELINRLRKKDEEDKEEMNRQGTCVICMDNLANVVCLPCKHLALCLDCGRNEMIKDCPICRVKVEDKMTIFTP